MISLTHQRVKCTWLENPQFTVVVFPCEEGKGTCSAYCKSLDSAVYSYMCKKVSAIRRDPTGAEDLMLAVFPHLR